MTPWGRSQGQRSGTEAAGVLLCTGVQQLVQQQTHTVLLIHSTVREARANMAAMMDLIQVSSLCRSGLGLSGLRLSVLRCVSVYAGMGGASPAAALS